MVEIGNVGRRIPRFKRMARPCGRGAAGRGRSRQRARESRIAFVAGACAIAIPCTRREEGLLCALPPAAPPSSSLRQGEDFLCAAEIELNRTAATRSGHSGDPLTSSEEIPTYDLASRGHRCWTSWICKRTPAGALGGRARCRGGVGVSTPSGRVIRARPAPILRGPTGGRSPQIGSRFSNLATVIRKKSRVECRVDLRTASPRGGGEPSVKSPSPPSALPRHGRAP
jgi:hypothetical protein